MTRDGPFFPDLPPELQIKIWRCALPSPRIVQLNGAFSFHGARLPTVLHTCRTSREVALTVFARAFIYNNKPIYFDFAHDTLYLANPEMCKTTAGLYPDMKEKIQSVAVEISSQEDLEKSVVDIGLSYLSNLREIIFVVGHEDKLVEFMYPERVRFSEPGAMAPPLWRDWKGSIEHMHLFKGCVVRVVETKIV